MFTWEKKPSKLCANNKLRCRWTINALDLFGMPSYCLAQIGCSPKCYHILATTFL